MFDRRQFINRFTFASPALFLGVKRQPGDYIKPLTLPSVVHNHPVSRVVRATRNDVFDGDTLNETPVYKLLDAAIEYLFQAEYKTIWKKLFSPQDTVGIKVNCLAGRGMSTHPELVNAIVERLTKAGVPPNQIIIWDRHDRDLKRAGFKLNDGRYQAQCYGTNQTGYSDSLYEHGSVASLMSRILTDYCTAMINVPILKDHGIVGMSGALKNNFGVINNPNKYHDNLGDPYVADVNMLPDIRKKTRLIICDALQPQYEGGPPFMPQWTWKMNGLLAAVDPVAHDRIGWQIIEDKRKANGLPSLAKAGREPGYIATAADHDHKLGTNDLDKIEYINV